MSEGTDKVQHTGGSRLSGRRIVIVGGGSGIGRETALLFASEGAAVAVLDRNVVAARSVAELCGGTGDAIDIVDDAGVEAAIARADAALGGLDGIVNTAGIFDPATLADTDIELWGRMMAVNLTGTYLLCRRALPALRRSQRSTIVTLGSATGVMPAGPGSAAYAASKGGVAALSRALAAEVAPDVRVNCVCPGMVDTPMTANVLRDADGNMRPEIIRNYALRRAAEPREIASAILFLTSDDSSFVTGMTMVVDGGRTYH